jgi:hypothetical protein
MVDRPPTLKELAGDPTYRRYLKTPPRLPESLAWGYPYRLYVELPRATKLLGINDDASSRWLTKKYHTYAEAWNKAVKVLRHPDTIDACIVSVRHFFDPPIVETKRLRNRQTKKITIRQVFWLPDPPYEWCFRCRRPTLFQSLPPDHHALRTQPVVSPDSPYRCWFCGIRRVAMPSAKHYNFYGVGTT